MAFILWSVVVLFYVFFGLLYLSIPQLSPLGAMDIPGISYELLGVFLCGYFSALFGYLLFRKCKIPSGAVLVNEYFMRFCSLCYLIFSLSLFLLGVQYYGGYIGFISTPYVAIFYGSAENEIKDVLISSSGLLSIFSILSACSVKKLNIKDKGIIAFSFFILLSIFIQGRRENLLLMIMCFLSYKFFGKKIGFKNLFKALLAVVVLILVAGFGLYLRASSSTSGGNMFDAVSYAVLYETHFTIANLANEIKIHTYNNIPYGGVVYIFYPIMFIIPSFIFSIFGYNKSDVFSMNDPKIYEDKGGSFVFTEAFHSIGIVGVIIHGFVLGVLLIFFLRLAKKNSMLFYHFPLVSLVFVASRKDITYGIKYMSFQFIFMFAFYILYSLLPKKK